MNSITFAVVCILAVLMVSSADYKLLSEKKVTLNSPYNFSFLDFNGFLLMEITLKNISKSVTAVYLVSTVKSSLNTTDPDIAPERVKVDAEIKNGEVKILMQKNLVNYRNILVNVELQTREGVCHTSKLAEGRHVSSTGNWNLDEFSGSGSCLVPKPCEIVAKLEKQCQEDFKCSFDATKYICTFTKTNIKISQSYNLYQTYDMGKSISKVYNKWRPQQPDNHGNEDCVHMNQEGEYNDVSCNVKRSFICKKSVPQPDPHNLTDRLRTTASFRPDYDFLNAVDSFYKIHKIKKNWYDAKQECVKEGASLFYPENRHEANAVISFWKLNQNTIQNETWVYVGISDISTEGSFETIDGKSISKVYNKWRPQQPDNHGNEDCVHMNQEGEYNDVSCNVKRSFICKKSVPQPDPHNLTSVIGVPLGSSAVNTKLIIELELFDNNTSVHVESSVHKRDLLWSDKIIMTEKDVVKEHIVSLTYSEATEVQFSCEEYRSRSKYLSVALVNTTENKIQMLNKTIYKRKFKIADNGSILCCLYYAYQSMNEGNEVNITRFVVNKTLLIYQHKELMPPKPADAVTIDITTIFISSVSVLILVLPLVVYVFMKQYQRETNRRETSKRPLPQTPRQNSLSKPDLNLPFYKNMLFRRECDLEIQAREEPQYDEVMDQ